MIYKEDGDITANLEVVKNEVDTTKAGVYTRLTEKQELKIKQMTTDIADMIEKDTAVPQGNDGIF